MVLECDLRFCISDNLPGIPILLVNEKCCSHSGPVVDTKVNKCSRIHVRT